MVFNLFITYDLAQPDQTDAAVQAAITGLGTHWRFQRTLFWVHTPLSPHAAFKAVRKAMDPDDKLCIINAHQGIISDWDRPPVDEIKAIWSAP